MCCASWSQVSTIPTLAKLNRPSLSYIKEVNKFRHPSEKKDLIKTRTHLPFFCAAEAKWDNKSKTKMRFRLGSQEYVDRLEGKLD
jgi:hypothetical protein